MSSMLLNSYKYFAPLAVESALFLFPTLLRPPCGHSSDSQVALSCIYWNMKQSDYLNCAFIFKERRMTRNKLPTVAGYSVVDALPAMVHFHKWFSSAAWLMHALWKIKHTAGSMIQWPSLPDFIPREPGYKSLTSYNYEIWYKKKDHTVNSEIPKFGVKWINS